MSNAVNFGSGSYSHELWIHGGQLFVNPTGVDVESVNAGAFALEVVDANGDIKAHNVTQNEHGGWTSWICRRWVSIMVLTKSSSSMRPLGHGKLSRGQSAPI